MKINKNFDNLVPNYLFADVAKKTAEFAKANPDKKIIKLGIGDVTLPLAPVVIEAMKKDDYAGYDEGNTPAYEVTQKHIKKVL